MSLRGLRPPRVGRPLAVVGALSLAFFGIARTTGAGWVLVLLCSLLGCMAVAFAAPLVGLGRVEVTVAAPGDGTVGQPAVIELGVPFGGQGLKLRSLDPTGEWVSADAPAVGDVLVTPSRRGVLDRIEVEVEGGGPLGLVRWRRRLDVALPSPLEVGPRPIDTPILDFESSGVTGLSSEMRGRLGHEAVRGIREYTAGDPIRTVHWPATARWGRLMVKELEDPDPPRLTVVVDLRGDPGRAELVASRAAGLTAAALREGLSVTLLTAETAGGVAGDVASPLEAGRRLARAVAAAPPEGPLPPGSIVVRLTAQSPAGGLA